MTCFYITFFVVCITFLILKSTTLHIIIKSLIPRNMCKFFWYNYIIRNITTINHCANI